ncbi:hypothetical protein KI387_002622, partial [Taxus chinensis]
MFELMGEFYRRLVAFAAIPSVSISTLYILVAMAALIVMRRRKEAKLKLPPGPRGWPLLGNLLQIGSVPHLGMRKINKKYGPLVYIKIGLVPAVVTDDPTYVKEFLLKQDRVFASRPRSIASDYLTYEGNDIAFAPYGSHWRSMKRICSAELLSPKKVEYTFRQGRNDEMQCMVNQVLEMAEAGQSINMRDLFASLANNTISRMVLGQRYFGPKGAASDLAAQHRAKIYESFSLVNAFNIGDYVPFLRVFDFQGQERRLRRLMAWIDSFYAGILEQYKVVDALTESGAPMNFLLRLLSHQSLTVATIKSIIIDMVAAGTDTTSTTSEWTVAELLHHPDYMTKVREEIESVVGYERQVEDYDLPRLNVLRAVVKEVFRLHPVGGFLIPHLSMQKTKVGGYDIPCNTRILINTYALGRNPAVWQDPHEFRPERFLCPSEMKLSLNDSECRIVPFGAGRRRCPGATLGSTVLLLGIARLIHLFEWFPANRKERLDEDDMKEAYGYTVKAQPLQAFAKP